MAWRCTKRTRIVNLILSAVIVFAVMKFLLKEEYSPEQDSKRNFWQGFQSHDQRFDLMDTFTYSFTIDGYHYEKRGIYQKLEHSLESSIIYSFSPMVESRFKEIILEPREEQRVYANSPAILWYRGELIAVLRIWLEKEKYTDGGVKPMNDFNDNFLYVQKFDKRMKPITVGSILGLPTPRQWTIGDGPIEPRLFMVGDDVFMSYNTGVFLKDGKGIDSTFIWDYRRHKTFVPQIEGGSPMTKKVYGDRLPRDKHWTPFIDNDELFMVYNLDPLRIMKCTTNFSCHFTHFEGDDNYEFVQYGDCLRGGSPWVKYNYPYYISVGHATLFKKPQDERVYHFNILVLRVSPMPRVVYTSGPIKIHPKPMTDVPIVRFQYITDPFFFPLSMIMEDPDSIVVGGHINDYSSYLVRVRGIKKLMEDVIAADVTLPSDQKGPPVGALHNSTKMIARKVTGYNFFSAGD